jgi:hypothetical protein
MNLVDAVKAVLTLCAAPSHGICSIPLVATAQIGAPGPFDGHHHLVLMEFAERVSEFQRFRNYRCLDPPGAVKRTAAKMVLQAGSERVFPLTDSHSSRASPIRVLSYP